MIINSLDIWYSKLKISVVSSDTGGQTQLSEEGIVSGVQKLVEDVVVTLSSQLECNSVLLEQV